MAMAMASSKLLPAAVKARTRGAAGRMKRPQLGGESSSSRRAGHWGELASHVILGGFSPGHRNATPKAQQNPQSWLEFRAAKVRLAIATACQPD